MDNFSKLHPPNAVHIKVKIIVSNEPKPPRPRSDHINECELFAPLSSITNLNHLSSRSINSLCDNNGNREAIDGHFKVLDAKKLYVDPLMTNFDLLHSLITNAFDLKQWVFLFLARWIKFKFKKFMLLTKDFRQNLANYILNFGV